MQSFRVTYMDKQSGQTVTEAPRLLISVDGAHKSLAIGTDPMILATVPYDTDDMEMWSAARSRLQVGAAKR